MEPWLTTGKVIICYSFEDMVDSSSFYEKPMILPLKDQHLLTVSAPAMVEFEVEATCCSQKDACLLWRTGNWLRSGISHPHSKSTDSGFALIAGSWYRLSSPLPHGCA